MAYYSFTPWEWEVGAANDANSKLVTPSQTEVFWQNGSSFSPSQTKQSPRPRPNPEEFVQVNGKRWGMNPQEPSSYVPSGQKQQKKKMGVDIEEEISSQSLYKTELCRSFEETGTCRYGSKCQFAHGQGELRPVLRHPKYKTEICKTFHTIGTCPYGKRCRFIHSGEEGNATSSDESEGETATSVNNRSGSGEWSTEWPKVDTASPKQAKQAKPAKVPPPSSPQQEWQASATFQASPRGNVPDSSGFMQAWPTTNGEEKIIATSSASKVTLAGTPPAAAAVPATSKRSASVPVTNKITSVIEEQRVSEAASNKFSNDIPTDEETMAAWRRLAIFQNLAE